MNSYTQPDTDSLMKTRDLHPPPPRLKVSLKSVAFTHSKRFFTPIQASHSQCVNILAWQKLNPSHLVRFSPQQVFINWKRTECPQNPIFISVLQISLLNGSLPTTCNRLFFKKLYKTLIKNIN